MSHMLNIRALLVCLLMILMGLSPPGAMSARCETMINSTGLSHGSANEPQAPGKLPEKVTAESILRSARAVFVRSKTAYLEEEQIESQLQKRKEFKAMELVIVKNEDQADIRIEINRAEFSFDYAFTAVNPATSIVVASGHVTAWNGGFAAPKIAREFLKQMQAARTAPVKK